MTTDDIGEIELFEQWLVKFSWYNHKWIIYYKWRSVYFCVVIETLLITLI